MSGHNTRSMGDDSDYYNQQNGHSSQKSTSDSEPKSTGPSFSEMLAKSATTVKPHYKKEIKPEPRSNSNTPIKKPGAGFSDDEDLPLSTRMGRVKTENTNNNNTSNNSYNDDDDDVPLSARLEKSVKKESSSSSSRLKLKRKMRDNSDDDDDDDYNNDDDDDDHGDEDYDDDEDVPLFKRAKKAKKEEKEKKVKHEDKKSQKSSSSSCSSKSKKPKLEPSTPSKSGSTTSITTTPTKKGKKSKEQEAKEEETKWKWWEEEKKDEGVKWKTLEHKGPLFAPLYERLPPSVHFYYDGRHVVLSDGAEEVAGFYARMLDHDYTTRDLFNKNYFRDWRKVMTGEERHLITDLKKCNFKEMFEHFKLKSEERKNMSKEEKQAIKKENEKIQSEYGFCIVDGHKQKIGNFRIEPPGLFRGRGEHPKQGMLKRRVQPEDVTINCSKGPNVPKPPAGHKWKEVRHDNTVTWLASWSENIQGSIKYVMLNAASRLKGEKDWMKYETARKLHKCIDKIRSNYKEDWKSKEMRIRQRAVALYFIDKLALRAGNEKDEDTADTVGCCSLRYEHVKLHETLEGKECVVEFDFLGKDSIRYTNTVAVEKRVFKNLQLFMENKQAGDDLFDRLNTTILNKHLQSLMDGLSAKVFRTYNASRTLQEQLDLLTVEDDPLPAKILAYNRANRQVAILCNHQRAAPKNFDKQMENLQGKIDAKKALVRAAKKELKDAKSDFKAKKSESARTAMNKKKKAYDRLNEQLAKLEMQLTDKDENKEIALGTSKLNYLDPRISIAWCKKWGVPIEKIYNKTQREKFAWAIDMAEADYHF